jgi:hypothetical protein
MNKIQKISSYLLLLFNLIIITIPLYISAEWIFINALEKNIQTPEGYVNLTNISWTSILKLLGFSAEIIGVLPFIISLFFLKAIFENYKKRDIFTIKNAILYRRLGFLFLISALVIKPLSEMLMILAVTFTNPPGHRYLTISYGTPNFISLFYGILVIIVSWVMLEANRMNDEQKFTI